MIPRILSRYSDLKPVTLVGTSVNITSGTNNTNNAINNLKNCDAEKRAQTLSPQELTNAKLQLTFKKNTLAKRLPDRGITSLY